MFLAPGVSRRSWVPHIAMFARHFTQGCDNAKFANLDYAVLAHWHLQRLCFASSHNLEKPCGPFKTVAYDNHLGKKKLGNPHFETYLPSDIRDNYVAFWSAISMPRNHRNCLKVSCICTRSTRFWMWLWTLQVHKF